jgi:hypothetical protein
VGAGSSMGWGSPGPDSLSKHPSYKLNCSKTKSDFNSKKIVVKKKINLLIF